VVEKGAAVREAGSPSCARGGAGASGGAWAGAPAVRKGGVSHAGGSLAHEAVAPRRGAKRGRGAKRAAARMGAPMRLYLIGIETN
jgi:hypothetical protein